MVGEAGQRVSIKAAAAAAAAAPCVTLAAFCSEKRMLIIRFIMLHDGPKSG